MSYQVLARKWRPRGFSEMVGQEHVLQALINALDNNRLHHAYLFTGTRGVGKTTIARILAKCLNCEEGVSSTPCDTCSSCSEITEGRFVDLIEVDAASRTKVEDTRELLENVQYAPTRGRYKIYLIDEVHMLSTHSFNALLKTLEEPPPHVKFLLATTDPQKLPVTILSRCLQFNLKNLGPDRIVEHLQHVLSEEQVPFEESGLWALARAADGSMRDALSLTDQAVAHGGGQVNEAEVNAMLGTIERSYVVDICMALAGGNGTDVLSAVSRMAEQAPDYDAALADVLSIWHQVAIAQTVPEALDQAVSHYLEILKLATDVSREDVQLIYQVCLLGRKDLQFSPDLKSGFEMVMLRALAFRPQTSADAKITSAAVPQEAETPVKKFETEVPSPAVDVQPVGEALPVDRKLQEAEETAAPTALEAVSSDSVPVKPVITESLEKERINTGKVKDAPLITDTSNQDALKNGIGEVAKIPLEEFLPEHWITVRGQLNIGASLGEIASHCLYLNRKAQQLNFLIDGNHTSLYDAAHQVSLANALSEYFGQPVSVDIEFGVPEAETPRAFAQRKKAERLEKAIETLHSDPSVEKFKELFNGALDEDSVHPID